MKNFIITSIAAMDLNRAIGFENALPWHMPTDFKRFKDRTKGHPIIMGRKTFDALGRSLPDRTNIIISRNKTVSNENCKVTSTVEEALEIAKESPNTSNEIFVIGGAEIYKLAFPFVTRLDLTYIDARIENADAWFPEFNKDNWKLVTEEKHRADDKNPYDFTFLTFERLK